jgi:purine-nucleoside phosphorylase
MEEVVTHVRVMAKLGVDEIITSNAVGSLRAEYPVGALVCIEDHISSFVPNVLIGPNDDSLGERFVGMNNIYDSSLRKTAHEAADELGIDLLDGIYLQVTGPTYESKAEAEMFASLGADIIGMSTACEAIALKHMNVKILSISCITDYCPNVNNIDTTHEEVLKNADKVSHEFVSLIKAIVRKL